MLKAITATIKLTWSEKWQTYVSNVEVDTCVTQKTIDRDKLYLLRCAVWQLDDQLEEIEEVVGKVGD